MDPKAQQLYNNIPALLFADHSMQQVENQQFQRLGQTLGTYWTSDMAEQLSAEDDSRQRLDSVNLPLSFIIRPEVQDMVKKMFGRKYGMMAPDWAKTKQIDMFNVDREEFIKVSQQFLPLIG